MAGFCNKSCGRCTTPGALSATTLSVMTQQEVRGLPPRSAAGGTNRNEDGKLCKHLLAIVKTNEHMRATDVRASAPAGCVDLPVPGAYTCAQQTGFGKCGEPFMNGYCDITCGRCTTATNGRTGVLNLLWHSQHDIWHAALCFNSQLLGHMADGPAVSCRSDATQLTRHLPL